MKRRDQGAEGWFPGAAFSVAAFWGWVLVASAWSCGGEAEVDVPCATYRPHAVLDIPTVIDVDGAPDIADPHVLKVGTTWYLYASQSKVDLHAWSSTDLETWTDAGAVWVPTPGSWNADYQAWAPHVQATDQGYYFYYTANRRIGLAWSDSPLGPFLELRADPFVGAGFGGIGDGQFDYLGTDNEMLDFEEFAIDACVLAAGDGSLTFYFTRYNPLSVIAALPMVDYETLAEVGPVEVAGPTVAWEGLGLEGVWVAEHAGQFHLMYSGNLAISENYAVGVAVSGAPLGPFEKRGDNPILHQHAEANFWAPGHHGLVAGCRDDLLMFYHTKVSAEEGYDRRIRYVPVSFDDAGVFRLDVAQP